MQKIPFKHKKNFFFFFYCEGGPTLAQVSQRGYGVSILGDIKKPDWTQSWSTIPCWPCSEYRLGLDDLSSDLNQSDFVNPEYIFTQWLGRSHVSRSREQSPGRDSGGRPKKGFSLLNQTGLLKMLSFLPFSWKTKVPCSFQTALLLGTGHDSGFINLPPMQTVKDWPLAVSDLHSE